MLSLSRELPTVRNPHIGYTRSANSSSDKHVTDRRTDRQTTAIIS